ncbi:metallopeptidase family protein [Corynebacterium otitidis]|uniref:metallopeptidase family protein n=1 Tax=Corynebacterium otitidis TaxID=29321 RepID=UPI000627C876|nr:metallopeptidase family protein [Corynebacterium otitidis]KKO83531.1 hypothetical protein AAV33_06040 [Corynebacterium otitidis]
MVKVSDERFDELVNDALDAIPERFARRLTEVVILVEQFDEDNPETLGVYNGVALPERTFDHTGYLPDTIVIYKGALERFCRDEEELAHEVHVTVFHEVAHFFGIDDDELHELGWG